ncbi:hypothetical protein, variant [Puccinia graminis f. sp. tritici CRL 75-36-700-3]|uniref:RRM domain-containing protein n=3 Tax=Puccinia graminis f. sp. tritici TaxID=56615 RepID=H6QRM9_PUCGT|nr:hypothetical protein, variant [Puccinia graminis f. sp. tritici CRL 75-36-700-3]EHS63323.1 hypothetical protein, variant [Puccinia graminis f. sp. tritici CRL 75-36-700-3]
MKIDSDKPLGRGRPSNGDHNPGNNLHVSGISTRAEDADLYELFSKYGRVQKAQLMRDPNTKEVRGFGFVTMETCEEADAAMTALNGADLFGKPLGVEKARRGRARTPTPGQYFGPAKRDERRYDPRGGGGGYGGGGGGGGGYRAEDRYGGYPERRERRYDDRGPPPGRDDRYGYAAPMRAERDRYDDRRDYDRPRRDDRDYDRRY